MPRQRHHPRPRGDDVICGGPGHDNIRSGSGNDRVHGQSGSDNIRGGTNDDRIAGGKAHDIIRGNRGDDILRGGSGADLIGGGHHDDRIYGGSGHDRLNGANGKDTIRGGNGDDLINGHNHNDDLHGQDGNDVLYGGKRGDMLTGASGDDELYAVRGWSNVLEGGPGDDLLDGGELGASAEYDTDHAPITIDLAEGTMTSADGNDRVAGLRSVRGTAGDDVIRGTQEDEAFVGRGGDDVLEGRGGWDRFYGGPGNDRMTGGDDNDSFFDADGDNWIDGGGEQQAGERWGTSGDWVPYDGDDVPEPTSGVNVDLESGTARHNRGTDTLIGVEIIWGTPFDDVVIGNADINSISAGAGDDELRGGGGDDILIGARGNDRMFGDDGSDLFADANGDNHIDGGSQPESGIGDYVPYRHVYPFYEHPAGGVNVDLETGVAEHSLGTDTLLGIENVLGTRHADVLLGDDGDNYLRGARHGDYLEGRGGDDMLVADTGPGDEADGGAGNDACQAQVKRNCERGYDPGSDPDLK